ncbi:extracellular solute-binding protein [Paracraurococcus ruber]|uniref:Fe(3+) ABC transporter substrate-binding protein n=1 Tax=Paracraurococcus ruber TaxID=77675 RepID=A0ABS1CZC6_9PROT|nr:extracellular solute-binding protein [Paracraurococcus ruber]MBK1659799.1 Fe(3+) ABC transporter substrate-binding protein [Paracraurococcus ruber]TDG34142.1 extracellular solute-binding protein [Paracraurococcus ruber]
MTDARPKRALLGLLAAGLASLGLAPAARAQEVNLYSSRHYDSDRTLYEAFTKETGIRVRLIEGDADQLIERIRNEGANSPADVFITVDAARLARAANAGILQPYRSAAVEQRIPAALRSKDGLWFAISQRARVIMFDREKGAPAGLQRYEDLGGPAGAGLCVRSSNHPYNISLVASILMADGPERTEAWAKGVSANLARPPQGGDRDQFRAIPAGQCTLALANTYYLAAFGASHRPEDQALFRRIGVIFPNQAEGDRGTHVNISGAGLVRTAPNRANAARLLDYLTGDHAQQVIALGNMEYPAVPDAPLHPALEAMGRFRAEPVDAEKTNANAAQALQILQRSGWR